MEPARGEWYAEIIVTHHYWVMTVHWVSFIVPPDALSSLFLLCALTGSSYGLHQ